MKNMMSFFRKNGFYVMALVLIAGILAISGIAGYVSGQSERNQAENAAEFKDRAAGTASNEAKLAESEAAVADEMTGYNADLVQKILSMIENGTLALEDFEEEGSMNGTAEASAKDAAAAENESAEVAEDEPEADTEEAEMAGNVLNAGYSSENAMSWPVRGEVIMDYSMDKTIYYPTLQEYKCNPSILIQSEEGTDVAAAFSGTVADVYHDCTAWSQWWRCLLAMAMKPIMDSWRMWMWQLEILSGRDRSLERSVHRLGSIPSKEVI